MITQIVNEILTMIGMVFKSVTYIIKTGYVWLRAFSKVSEHSADEYVKESLDASKTSDVDRVVDLDNL